MRLRSRSCVLVAVMLKRHSDISPLEQFKASTSALTLFRDLTVYLAPIMPELAQKVWKRYEEKFRL